MAIGIKLRELREAKGWSTRALQKHAQVSNVMITRYETGKALPTKAVLERLANALGVPIIELSEPETIGSGKEERVGFNEKQFARNLSQARVQLELSERRLLNSFVEILLRDQRVRRSLEKN